MEALMETLVNKDFTLVEDSSDAVVYAKDLNSGEQEMVTFLLEDGEILHERYNKNGVQTFSEKEASKDGVRATMMIASIR